jgi:hypothetical protein
VKAQTGGLNELQDLMRWFSISFPGYGAGYGPDEKLLFLITPLAKDNQRISAEAGHHYGTATSLRDQLHLLPSFLAAAPPVHKRSQGGGVTHRNNGQPSG